jgi:hypothetical protein
MKEQIDNWHKSHPQVQSNIIEVAATPSVGNTIALSVSSLAHIDSTNQDEEELARLEAVALAAIRRQEEIRK